MVNNGYSELRVIRQELGKGTGDMIYQTQDGRWWEPWDGQIKTGEIVEILETKK